MKTIIATICALSMGYIGISAQPNVPKTHALPGWSSLKGDEFNGSSVDKKLWGLYGDATKNYANDYYGNNTGQGMAQVYRDKMVTVKNGILTVRATRDAIQTGIHRPSPPDPDVDYGPIMRYPLKPNHNYTTIGWWSGALSSRDAEGGGRYYPLYSRIEVKAKIPYTIGVWMALWLRHRYGGAGTFEIDLEEFFVNDDDKDITHNWEGHTYHFKGKRTIHQSVHGLDRAKAYKDPNTGETKYKTTYNHNDFADRIREIDFNPAEDFHVYGAQMDPLPGDSSVHLAVSFLLDGRVRSVFTTKTDKVGGSSEYRFNELLKDKYIKGNIDHIWDVAITGQVGGKPDGQGGGVLYPEMDPKYGGNLNKVPRNYEMDIDWLRVFKRTNKALWLGSMPKGSDWKTKNVALEMSATQFKGLQVGDQLVMDIDTLSNSEYRKVGKLKLDIYDYNGNAITTLKPELAQRDAQVTFIVTDDLCKKLKAKGGVMKGENIRLFSVCRSQRDSAKWVGFKQMENGEVLIPATMFADIEKGQQIEVMVRDVAAGGTLCLQQFKKPDAGKNQRPDLSADKAAGNVLPLKAGRDENTYTFTLNAQAVKELKQHGLAVMGKGCYLRSVRIVGEKKNTVVNKVETHAQTDTAVYTIDGRKVAERWQEGTLPRGIYIVGGRKVIVK